MAVPASIVFPTRRRRDYLAVALASVAPQAAAHGCELLVVEDDPHDPETAALAARFGARYLAHGAPRGLNAARNTALDATATDLVCFLDDDVEAWPGWLDALLAGVGRRAGPRGVRRPDPRAAGGLEAAQLRARAAAGDDARPRPATTSTPSSPGARTSRCAARALERTGRFEEALDLYGDEEDWQRRFKAAGGRVRYVAGAGVDHRRAGRDARLLGLSRAAFRRGRNSRRYDVRKGVAPAPWAELRTLAGCLWHVVRRRCGTGIVLSALTLGRIAETFDPAPQPPNAGDPQYLSGRSGTLGRRGALAGAVRDARAGLLGLPARWQRPARGAASAAPARARRRRGPARAPAHGGEAARRAAALATQLSRCIWRHPAPGAGKWANVNAALAAAPATDADWLLIVDDDVVLPRGFLDRFLLLAERFGFELAQPAHAFASHAAWDVTRRRPGVLAHRTRFVEIGPVTALSATAAAALLPFPDLQMGWGLDARWSAIAAERGWPVGVIDATPGPPPAPGRRRLPARRRDRRGRGVPRRSRLRDARRGRRGARGAPRAVSAAAAAPAAAGAPRPLGRASTRRRLPARAAPLP